MEDILWGWGEIAKYLGLHPRTAQRYEETRGLPVQRRPGGGPKAPVFARKSELDHWLSSHQTDADIPEGRTQGPGRDSKQSVELAVSLLDRIRGIGRGTKLYRRYYVLHFALRRAGERVQANVECRFELCNATDQKQPYTQEVTVDDSDH